MINIKLSINRLYIYLYRMTICDNVAEKHDLKKIAVMSHKYAKIYYHAYMRIKIFKKVRIT